ncbi:hypothetical protein AAG906_000252 [Vitis piasezkii]
MLFCDGQSVPDEMKLLFSNESPELSCRTTFFDSVTLSCPLELRELCEEMVRKCTGLPHATVVLGGLLSRNKLPTEWAKMLNYIGMHLSRGKEVVDAMLTLSYMDSPPYLKSCFLHLGLFPKDQAVSTRKLLLPWIAEGLVIQQDQQRMEDVAEDYLNELINRNLFEFSGNER